MRDKYINILIINNQDSELKTLCSILEHQSHNIHTATSGYSALHILKKNEIGIILVSSELERMKLNEVLKTIREFTKIQSSFILVTANHDIPDEEMTEALALGAMDYVKKPYNEELLKSKINVYKDLYFNQQRVLKLLKNVLPEKVLSEFYKYGKSSPKRYENGIVLFTDFVSFSTISKNTAPIHLIKRLDNYFSKFDEIIEKYNLEKIKTIGDAYMVVAGISDDEQHNDYLAMALAAIEMRDFIHNEEITSLAFGETPWKMRMGIHTGPLVAGVIGSKKFSFDVWGNTVNIAARTEEYSAPGALCATRAFVSKIDKYFNIEKRGKIEIRKHGGLFDMFHIKDLKAEYSLNGDCKIVNTELRKILNLPLVDFEHARNAIINRLKSGLDEELAYHSLEHTLEVEKAVIRIGKIEGIGKNDTILLRTAALFHDAGFIVEYNHNEKMGVLIMRAMLPQFGYSNEQIAIIEKIILSTQSHTKPDTELEKIMCDADHDYLGKPEYQTVANRLRKELEFQGVHFSDVEWIEFQLDYLENKHHYYTNTSKNMRSKGKSLRIMELKKQLELAY